MRDVEPTNDNPGGMPPEWARGFWKRIRKAPSWAMLCLLFLATACVSWRVHYLVEQRARARFDLAVTTTVRMLDLYFEQYLSVLSGFRGLSALYPTLWPEAFKAYVESGQLWERNPGLMDIGFIANLKPGVEPADHPLLKRLQITKLHPEVPAGGERWILSYLLDRAQLHFIPDGWNAYSDSVRRACMERARDTGRAVLTPPVPVRVAWNLTNQPPGFVVYYPLYQGTALPATIEERRERLAGFIFGSFSLARVGRDVRDTPGSFQIGLSAWVGGSVGATNLYFATNELDSKTRAFSVDWKMVEPPWRLSFWRLSTFEAQSGWLLLLVSGAGLVVSFVVFLMARGQEAAFAREEKFGAELAKANEALRQSQERLELVLREAPVALFAIDPSGKFTLSAGKGLRSFGGERGEVAGQSVYEHYQNHPEVLQAIRRALGGESVSGTWTLRQSVFDAWLVPIRDPAGVVCGVSGVAVDVTERNRLETEHVRVGKLESLGVLAGGIAHDFNNLLTSILGNISLGRFSATGNEELRTLLADAEESCMRARQLSQQLLTFAHGGAPVKQLTALPNLIRESARFVNPGTKDLCTFTLAPDLWPVEADVGQISRVIQNLVMNAEEAAGTSAPIAVSGSNVALKEGNSEGLPAGVYVHLSVRDKGPGIPAEVISRIYDPYFSTKPGARGLGLSIAHSVVKRHGGHIRVESKPGGGTCFHLFLPASPDVAARLAPVPREEPLLGQGRILVMDDEQSIRVLARAILRKLGYEVVLAADGPEALTKYQEARDAGTPFAAVILDLSIPRGIGGKEVMSRMLEADPQARGIVSSGYSNDPVMSDYQKYGFQGVVAKPYSIEELGAVVAQVLGAETPHHPE